MSEFVVEILTPELIREMRDGARFHGFDDLAALCDRALAGDEEAFLQLARQVCESLEAPATLN